MPSNFYNLHGLMHGVDPHLYHAFPEIPVPMPHIVAAPLIWFDSTPHKVARTVTMNGVSALCGGYTNMAVPHVPVPLLPPGPAEPAWLAAVILGSSSKAQLSAHKVTHGGEALAVCVISMVGLNVNCCDPFDAPTGAVLNINSVETQPTAGDYAGAIAGYIVDAAIGWAFGEFATKKTDKKRWQLAIKWAARVSPDIAKVLADIQDPAGKVQELVQKLVDGDGEATVPFLPPIIPPIKVSR